MDGHSPSAIAGRIRYVETALPTVSKNTIYEFLDSSYGAIITIKRKKKKQSRRRRKVHQLKDRVFIDQRPSHIELRKEFGHCERDLIVSGKEGGGYLLVVVERKSRVCFLKKIEDVSIDNVHKSFLEIQNNFTEMKRLTLDNDILFRMHKTLELLLGIPLYFCHPYHSWEKGSVENTNKYIRKYITKGSDISSYDNDFIFSVEEKCNDRFMECLAYRTPGEVCEREMKNNAKAL